MKHSKAGAFLALLITACTALLYSAYVDVKNRTIGQLNSLQFTLARQAAGSIEDSFEKLSAGLYNLSRIDHIVSMNDRGKELMQFFHSMHTGEIAAVTRTDPQGRVIHTFPANPALITLENHEHIQEIIRTRRPVLSDVLITLAGSASIAYHVPVFENGSYQGSLGVAIPFDLLARRHLEAIRIGDDGYGWAISRKGIELYCPVPGHVGKTVFENCKDFPDILRMAEEMVKGNRGETTYVFDRIRGETIERVKKHAVYIPVRLGDTFWSLVVATPESEVIDSIQGFRDRWLLVAGILLITVALSVYYLVRASFIIREDAERRLAEAALKDNEQLLRSIIQTSPIPTFVIGRDHRVIHWNKALEELTRVKADEVVGTTEHWRAFYSEQRPCFVDMVVDEDPEAYGLWRAGHKSGLSEDAYESTNHFPGMAGGSKWLHFTVATIRNSQGLPVGAIEIIEDITERKRSEEALLGYQQQLADIINFLPDATLVIDKEGKVIAWNLAMEDMTGIQAAAILGKGNYEYALPFYGERRPILIDLVLKPQKEVEAAYNYVDRKGTVISGEAYMPGLRGGEAYLFGKASALFDSKGNIVGAIESIRDISERRRVEEALVLAEEKYRGIFENAMEGIYQSTLDGRFLSINPALAYMLGYDSPEETLNTVTDITRQLYVNPKHRVELLRLLIEHGVVIKHEIPFFRKDGDIAWVALNARAVRDKTGRIIYMEGTAEDISDRKALEAQLVQAQKMEAIGTLAGGIAHDFNNILTPIIGYSELALQEIPTGTQLHNNMEQILRAGCRAKDLVKQILTFSRKTEQGRGPVQVGLLVKETLQMLRSTLPSTIDIRKHIHKDARYGTIMANPTQIHQVLLNLCTNAAHAMRENGGVLTISLARVDIASGSGAAGPGVEDGPYLKLSVSDTGHGMDEGVKQRIFNPYFTTKGPEEGTGLGLAVVYGIVKGLDGEITVISNPGEGTTFHVFFPVAETVETFPEAAPQLPPMGSGRVLVVDDEESVGKMLKIMLEQLGYEAVLRYSSADALEAFQARPEHFDLVITDQTMPHITGIDLAKEMLKLRPDIPIILCTGFSAMADENRAREIGISAFLMKPIVFQQLAEELHGLLHY
ncbi:MAG: PAS domain S-box protein [Syntrophobacter sp.]